MNARCLFLTGATGLLGGYLLDRLATSNSDELHLLIRAQDQDQARQRIRQLGEYFGRSDLHEHVTLHCGCISQPNLGLSADAQALIRDKVTDVIHVAASISFTDEATNRAVNQLGTRHLLDLIAPSARLFYFSTAYVAGMAPAIREDQLDLAQTFRNNYEQSKFETERMVRQQFQDRTANLTVLRPSIITGEWKNGRTFQFMTLYRVLRALVAFARRHPGETFSLEYDPDATQNYIPIDRLTDMTTEVLANPQFWGTTHHLVNPAPITNRQFSLWTLPPKGGTTNTVKSSKNAFVVPASAGISAG